MPVPGDVGPAPGVEVRADSHGRVLALEASERRLEPRGLRDVTGRVENGDVRSLGAVPECLQDSLVRLVRRVAWDRELLEPAVRDSGRRKEAEREETDPGGDDEQAVLHDEPGDVLEHQRPMLNRPQTGRNPPSERSPSRLSATIGGRAGHRFDTVRVPCIIAPSSPRRSSDPRGLVSYEAALDSP